MKYVVALGALLIGMSQAQAATVSVGGTYDVDSDLGVTGLSDFIGNGARAFDAHHTNGGGALGGYPTFTDPASPLYSDLLGFLFNGNYSEDRLTFNDKTGSPDNSTGAAYTGPNPNAYLDATFGGNIFNNDGYDIYIFESGQGPGYPGAYDPGNYSNGQYEMVAASTTGAAGSWVTSTILGFVTAHDLGITSSSDTTYGLYVLGIDLSSLGVAAGESVSSLFFGNTCGVTCNGGADNPDVEWIGGVAGANVAAVPLPDGLPLLAGGFGLLALLGLRRKSALRAA